MQTHEIRVACLRSTIVPAVKYFAPAATKALADAAGDKSWLVRAAALEALAKRGDPSVLDNIELYMSDEKDAVKYTAAATVLRLMAIKESAPAVMKRKKNENKSLR